MRYARSNEGIEPLTLRLDGTFVTIWAMNIGALPRRCRPFSRTESGPLKSQEQYKTQRRSASALFPIAHEKPVFVVGSWSLGPRHVLEINERNCGSENKKDLGEDTSRGEITKGGRSGGIVVGG